MNYRSIQLLLVFFVAAMLVAPVAQVARASGAEDGSISAASIVLAEYGTIGTYSMPDPAKCSHFSGSSVNTIQALNPPKAAAVPGYASQKVGVIPSYHHRLPNGTLATGVQGSEQFQMVGPAQTPIASPSMTLPLGPDYVLVYQIVWYASNGTAQLGTVFVAFASYQSWVDGVAVIAPNTPVCASPWPEYVEASATTGTVNSTLTYHLHRYPMYVDVPITWDGSQIGTIKTNNDAEAHGSIKIPAAPMGPHTIRWNYGHWQTSHVFTIKPRIKVIPSTVSRGQTVNVSLRGYKAGEVVRIRWQKGAGWVQIATVTTSATGSANINVHVPNFVPDGATKVRGDSVNATGGRAQTNAVTVSGGPLSSSSAKVTTPTPSPTSTPQATASPSPTPSATQTPMATASTEASPKATATATATTPAETPTPEPTQPPAASPVAP